MVNPLIEQFTAGQLPHAVILETDPATARTAVDEFITQLELNPADYYDFSLEGPIKVATAREMIRFAQLSRSTSKIKLITLLDASLLSIESANALLKTIEEPPEQTHIIFAITQADNLLPTIRSRCTVFPLTSQVLEPTFSALQFSTLAEAFALSKTLAEKETDLQQLLRDWLIHESRAAETPKTRQRETVLLSYLTRAKNNPNRRLFLDNLLLELYNKGIA